MGTTISAQARRRSHLTLQSKPFVLELDGEAASRAPIVPAAGADAHDWSEYHRLHEAWVAQELAAAIERLPELAARIEGYLTDLVGSGRDGLDDISKHGSIAPALGQLIGGSSMESRYRYRPSTSLADLGLNPASQGAGRALDPPGPGSWSVRTETSTDGTTVTSGTVWTDYGRLEYTVLERPDGTTEIQAENSDGRGGTTKEYTIITRGGNWVRHTRVERDGRVVEDTVHGDPALFDGPVLHKSEKPAESSKEKPTKKDDFTVNPNPEEPEILDPALRALIRTLLIRNTGDGRFDTTIRRPVHVDPGAEGEGSAPREGVRLVIDRDSLVRLLDGSERLGSVTRIPSAPSVESRKTPGATPPQRGV